MKPMLSDSHICLTRLDFPSPLSPQIKAVMLALAHRVTASLIVAIVAIVLSPIVVIVLGTVTGCRLLENGISSDYKSCHDAVGSIHLFLRSLRWIYELRFSLG